jgi:hypothetical protein
VSQSAQVRSVEAIARFWAALKVFQDEALGAVGQLEQQTGRALMWFDQEAPAAWKRHVRASHDLLGEARARLETCRNRTVAGHRPYCYEERLAVEAARRRLREAQEKVETVHQWGLRMHRDTDEFRGRVGRLKRYLEGDLERTSALLERTLAALEQYLSRPAGPAEPAATPDDDGQSSRESSGQSTDQTSPAE